MASVKETNHLRIPFQEIKDATENFTTVIGRGGFGPVYRGQLSLFGELTTVAVKRLDNLSRQGLKEFLTEIQLLSRYQHHNLVSLVGFCEDLNEKFLIYEYADRGSLDRFLRPTKTRCPLTWKQRINICIDVARGLDHLHNHVAQHERVIHRDIKSSNILIDHNWKAVVADFGLSKLGRANEHDTFLITNACGTPGYCDPVYFRTWILTKESDVYSFGVVLLEVVCGRMCFISSNNFNNEERFLTPLAQRYFKEENLNLVIDPGLKNYMNSDSMKVFLEIVFQCLKDEREQRPSMDSMLQELEKALKLLELEEALGLNKLVETLQLLEFAKRVGKIKRKKKDFSPQAAAMMIQMTFRTYMIRRSQALRALRQLAIVKGKLKGLMDLFNNFSCRYQVARDEEERLKFSEKFIVMLLNIESVEGATILVRASKRSMVVKLEAMLDVVDPQLGWGKSLSLKRSTFNMQDGVIQKGTAEGVTQAFSKRVEKNKKKKKKELSPQDAAMMIQITFRAYMIRRSQALSALRDLATLKEKVNKHMALFYNISYRRKVARDEDERVRFYEKLLVMLLTIDAIEGATIQMRASKRLMRVKLVAMLDVVDPQPGWFKSLYLKRRTFGMQDRVIQKEVTGDITKGVHMIRQALAKRVEKKQRKKKELSPQDAAMVIQMTFGAYMIRRSRALRALHELDIVKGKLKELMALYNNFSYRRRVARDEKERLKFSEKFMVMLISFDAIEGVNIQVRATKMSLVDKLEAMMDIVDPQPGEGKSLSLKRWAFDMPDGVIRMEVAKGVRMIGRDDGSETFE